MKLDSAAHLKIISQAGIIWQESVLMSQRLDLMEPMGSVLAVNSCLSGLGISHTPLCHTRHTDTHNPTCQNTHTSILLNPKLPSF